MRGDASQPVDVEPAFWDLADTVNALRNRDLGRLFRLVAVHTAASQTRIGVATGLSQGQVSQVMNGTRKLGSLDVLERVADGLAMPDQARMSLGLAPLMGPPNDPSEPSEVYPTTIRVAVTALDRLSVLDNAGRPETLNSRFSGLGFVTASRDWLVARSLAGWAGADPAPGRVASADVAAVRDTFAAFQELDTKYGGAYAHPALAQYIRLQAVPMLSAGCADPVRRELFTATAQLVYLTGLTAFDSGSCGAAERYFAYALRLAQECGEDGFAANILAAMAHLANTHGRGTEAAQLAQAGLVAAMRSGSHAAQMRLGIALARAYAIQGDRQAATTAVSGAERALDLSGNGGQEQRWTRFLDSAYLLGEMALCFIELGQPKLAERFAAQSVAVNAGRHRRLVLSRAALATARGQLGDADGAVTALTDALDLMGGVQSSRTLRSVGDALTAVRSASGHRPELARATAILGPKASGACCPRVPIPSSNRVR